MTIPESQDQTKKRVRADIRRGGNFNWSYLLMNILATIIASYGLMANSPAVVIGAMVIAMLLQPIAGISLAVIDSDMKTLLKSLYTLMIGTICVITTAVIIGTIHKDLPITNEIMARTAPNLFDLIVALAGGAAGAYATVKPRLSTALVGVAIATALVPPLSSAGILFSWGEVDLALNALLLVLTNMVAIQFSFSVVLWFSGIHQVNRSSDIHLLSFLKRNFFSMVFLLLLTITLSISLDTVITRQIYESITYQILEQEINSSAGYHLEEVRFEINEETAIVRAIMRGPKPPLASQIEAMETKLPDPPDGSKIELQIRFIQAMDINRNGQIFAGGLFGVSD